MIVCRTLSEWMQTKKKFIRKEGTLALVPTMGALHEGHLSLINKAKREHRVVVVTIFINPLQFGENEDFDAYPRTPEVDIKKAEAAGADVIWLPAVQDVYQEKQAVTMDVGHLGEPLCGASRPGHFNGMATVVMKFLQLVKPDAAYFGNKDAQQLAIIKKMTADFNVDVEIIGGETVRAEDGLALSSRNAYLTKEERKDASQLYLALTEGEAYIRDGGQSFLDMKTIVLRELKKMRAEVEYVDVRTFPHLEETSRHVTEGNYVIAAAIRYSQARLIDNIIFQVDP